MSETDPELAVPASGLLHGPFMLGPVVTLPALIPACRADPIVSALMASSFSRAQAEVGPSLPAPRPNVYWVHECGSRTRLVQMKDLLCLTDRGASQRAAQPMSAIAR